MIAIMQAFCVSASHMAANKKPLVSPISKTGDTAAYI
jgi:hypothetical protein